MNSIPPPRFPWQRLSAVFWLPALLAIASPSRAQLVAVPYYGPEAFVAALEARAQLPRAVRFAASAEALVAAISGLCEARGEAEPAAATRQGIVGREGGRDGGRERGQPDADGEPPGPARLQAREAWLAAADAWERLQAVSVGPTIDRRSGRTLDFRPARPALIKRAIGVHGKAREAPDAKALERVGTPAKGLPALEWLLWDPAAPQTPSACRYAVGLAQDVRREAGELAAAHESDAERNWTEDAEAAVNRFAEAVNQWLAGLETLRWRYLGKPLAMLAAKEGAPLEARQDIWPRPPSASHREVWQARWESLRDLAIGPAPTDGFGPQPAVAPGVISLEALLRGRGHNGDADRWAQVVMAADQAMEALTREGAPVPAQAPGREMAPSVPRPGPLPPPAAMQEAVKALDAVKQFMQDSLAPGLTVTLGFSDADGD